MIPGRSSGNVRTAVLLAVLPCLPATVGCARTADGVPSAAPDESFPDSAEAVSYTHLTLPTKA